VACLEPQPGGAHTARGAGQDVLGEGGQTVVTFSASGSCRGDALNLTTTSSLAFPTAVIASLASASARFACESRTSCGPPSPSAMTMNAGSRQPQGSVAAAMASVSPRGRLRHRGRRFVEHPPQLADDRWGCHRRVRPGHRNRRSRRPEDGRPRGASRCDHRGRHGCGSSRTVRETRRRSCRSARMRAARHRSRRA